MLFIFTKGRLRILVTIMRSMWTLEKLVCIHIVTVVAEETTVVQIIVAVSESKK